VQNEVIQEMTLILDVPYEEKDKAKQLGARWNPTLKKWYVENRADYHRFGEWIFREQCEGVIICNQYYIVVGTKTCFRCHKPTKAIGFGIDDYIDFADPSEYEIRGDNFSFSSGDISICSLLEPLPSTVLSYLKSEFGVFESYSKQAGGGYLANHCSSCGVIQGNFYLFGETDSPFFIDSSEKAAALNLLRVKTPYDFIASADISWGSLDYLIKEKASIDDISV
jgi:hypothetical protein